MKIAGAFRTQVNDDGFHAPFSEAMERGFQIRRVGKFRQLSHVTMSERDQWQHCANGLLAGADFFGAAYAPLRIPIQVDGSGNAKLACVPKQPLVPPPNSIAFENQMSARKRC